MALLDRLFGRGGGEREPSEQDQLINWQTKLADWKQALEKHAGAIPVRFGLVAELNSRQKNSPVGQLEVARALKQSPHTGDTMWLTHSDASKVFTPIALYVPEFDWARFYVEELERWPYLPKLTAEQRIDTPCGPVPLMLLVQSDRTRYASVALKFRAAVQPLHPILEKISQTDTYKRLHPEAAASTALNNPHKNDFGVPEILAERERTRGRHSAAVAADERRQALEVNTTKAVLAAWARPTATEATDGEELGTTRPNNLTGPQLADERAREAERQATAERARAQRQAEEEATTAAIRSTLTKPPAPATDASGQWLDTRHLAEDLRIQREYLAKEAAKEQPPKVAGTLAEQTAPTAPATAAPTEPPAQEMTFAQAQEAVGLYVEPRVEPPPPPPKRRKITEEVPVTPEPAEFTAPESVVAPAQDDMLDYEEVEAGPGVEWLDSTHTADDFETLKDKLAANDFETLRDRLASEVADKEKEYGEASMPDAAQWAKARRQNKSIDSAIRETLAAPPVLPDTRARGAWLKPKPQADDFQTLRDNLAKEVAHKKYNAEPLPPKATTQPQEGILGYKEAQEQLGAQVDLTPPQERPWSAAMAKKVLGMRAEPPPIPGDAALAELQKEVAETEFTKELAALTKLSPQERIWKIQERWFEPKGFAPQMRQLIEENYYDSFNVGGIAVYLGQEVLYAPPGKKGAAPKKCVVVGRSKDSLRAVKGGPAIEDGLILRDEKNRQFAISGKPENIAAICSLDGKPLNSFRA